ncbi:MAG: hypothetical protein RLZZ605_396, partial [Bacteroidota bacterium]|jgi:hypothetical protein
MIQATILEEPSGAKEVKDIKRLSSI